MGKCNDALRVWPIALRQWSMVQRISLRGYTTTQQRGPPHSADKKRVHFVLHLIPQVESSIWSTSTWSQPSNSRALFKCAGHLANCAALLAKCAARLTKLFVKCAARLGNRAAPLVNRAAHLANRADGHWLFAQRDWPNAARLTNWSTAQRDWPKAQIDQMRAT